MNIIDVSSPTGPSNSGSVKFKGLTADRAAFSDDLLDIWGFLKRRKKIIAAFTALLALIGTTTVLQIKPQYTAEASVMLDLRPQGVDVQAMLAGTSGLENYLPLTLTENMERTL